MFKNYFKVAIRSLLKRKGFSAINILGLATGMAVVILIVLFIDSELGYDRHHENADDIYRIALERRYPGRSTSYSNIPHSIGEAFQKEFPEVNQSTRVFNFNNAGSFFLRINDQLHEEKRVLGADSNFFNVFTSNFINGDPATALSKPNAVVLTESAAKKLYGSVEKAMGNTFTTDGGDNNNNNVFSINGVIKDWPENSHFLFDILVSTVAAPFLQQPNYIGFSAHTYLLLHPNASPKAIEAKVPQLLEKYVAGEVGRRFGQTFAEFQAEGNGYNYYLQPLKKIHLTSHLESELRTNGSITSVYIFSAIAVFILLLACINFINLSTARSMERAKEVGIRKTFGSDKTMLVKQFLIESMIISVLAVIAAFVVVIVLLPMFNQLTNKELSLLTLFTPKTLIVILSLVLMVGFVAGLYPAFVLSSFNPIYVLKGRFKSSTMGLALRNGLVVFQFAISVVLIICTIVVNQQMKFMTEGELGFNKEQVLVVQGANVLAQQREAFNTELKKLVSVEAISNASTIPGNANYFGTTFQQKGAKEQMTGRGVVADNQFAQVLQLEMKEGRFFSPQFLTDSLAVVLNEKAVSELGLTNPVGAKLNNLDDNFNPPGGPPHEFTVVGVVKDFHFQSMHQAISPLVIMNAAQFQNFLPLTAIRTKGNNLQKTINDVEQTWKKFVKDEPFKFTFLDQTLENQYVAEQTTKRVFSAFSVLAIFIACIGLLGLVAYATQLRSREISIRKVLGASVSNVIKMLSVDFMKLVLIASLIAFPVAWLGMNKWLEDFAYRINVQWWVLILSALGALAVALFTISIQAIKAALSNPVRNLRSE